MAAAKIDATLISAKMHVINHVYTNLWCFQEQIIKKYMFIILFPVKLLINFSRVAPLEICIVSMEEPIEEKRSFCYFITVSNFCISLFC